VLVVAENLVSGPRVEDREVGAVLGDRLEFVRQSPPRALASHSRQAIAERFGHSFGLRFPGLPGQFCGQPFGFGVSVN
jgi:hypothetical protein